MAINTKYRFMSGRRRLVFARVVNKALAKISLIDEESAV